MSRNSVFLTAAVLLAVGPAMVPAQAKLPPIRPLGATEYTSKELFGAVSTTRALSDGRVLVNDIIGRRVVLFDPTLSTFSVVADTTSATANAYSSRFGGLIAYRGDSSLFVDPTSLSMLVIDPAGNVARVMSIPRPGDAGSLVGGQAGFPAFDAQGRLVYRGSPQLRIGGPAGAPGARPANPPPTGQTNIPRMPEFPDSLPLVRVELATRTLDTVTFVRIPKTRMSVTQDSTGRMRMTSIMNPLPQVDDWAVLADGSIAVVRGLDYHIDFVGADGTRASSSKIPFDWRRLTDSAKVAFLDSTRVAMQKVRDAANAQRAAGGGPSPIVAPPDGGPVMGGGGGQVMVFTRAGAEGAARDGAPRPRDQTAAPANFTLPPLQFVEPNELPDYAPPFAGGSARADMDGNLWIRTTNVVNGGPVYDVISAKGELLDRVALPTGRVIAGFGPKGIVYMGVRETGGVRLEQARRPVVALP